jgi:hypothetical protein
MADATSLSHQVKTHFQTLARPLESPDERDGTPRCAKATFEWIRMAQTRLQLRRREMAKFRARARRQRRDRLESRRSSVYSAASSQPGSRKRMLDAALGFEGRDGTFGRMGGEPGA